MAERGTLFGYAIFRVKVRYRPAAETDRNDNFPQRVESVEVAVTKYSTFNALTAPRDLLNDISPDFVLTAEVIFAGLRGLLEYGAVYIYELTLKKKKAKNTKLCNTKRKWRQCRFQIRHKNY